MCIFVSCGRYFKGLVSQLFGSISAGPNVRENMYVTLVLVIFWDVMITIIQTDVKQPRLKMAWFLILLSILVLWIHLNSEYRVLALFWAQVKQMAFMFIFFMLRMKNLWRGFNTVGDVSEMSIRRRWNLHQMKRTCGFFLYLKPCFVSPLVSWREMTAT